MRNVVSFERHKKHQKLDSGEKRSHRSTIGESGHFEIDYINSDDKGESSEDLNEINKETK